MNVRIVIIIGPIGAGKGTQADVLVENYGMTHFETSKYLEARFAADPALAEQRTLWSSGTLNDPTWVSGIVLEEVRKLVEAGVRGIAFSSSPRTLPEVKALMPVFEQWFGKENILIFNIDLSEAESIKRNSARRICQARRHPIPNFPEYRGINECPFPRANPDRSPLMTRPLDQPEVIKKRYQEYLTRTAPILDYLRGRNYEIVPINGEQAIEAVSADMLKHLQSHHLGSPAPVS